MANVKITELAQETNPASDDVLPIVDVDAASGGGETKKITIADLLENAGDGSAGAPAFAFDNDADTGMYSAGANALGFTTGGTGRLFINSNGHAGIGTSSPDRLVHIFKGEAGTAISDSNTALMIENSTHAIIQMASPNNFSNRILFGDPQDADAGKLLYDHSNNSLQFYVNASERVRIDSSGNVGIGTASPSSDLDVFNTGFVNLKVRSSGTNTAALNLTNSTRNYSINSSGGALTFFDATASSERMRIDNAGKLGVGTSSPEQLLHVQSDTSPTVYIKSDNATTGSYSQLEFGNGGANTSAKSRIKSYRMSSASAATNLAFETTNSSSTTSEKLRIDSLGRLLVQSTSAPTQGVYSQYAPLTVQGYIGSTTGNGILNVARGTTAANLSSDSDIGTVVFSDSAGGEFARISCFADAAPGSNDYPGRISFHTSSDGASSPTERMRIDSLARITLGSQTDPSFATEPPVTNFFTSATPTTNDTAGTGTWAANASIAPDGTKTASKFTAGSTPAQSRFSQISSSVNLNSTAYTLSFYAKSESGSSQTLSVDLGDDQAGSITVTTSWQRFVFTSLVPTSGRFIDITSIDGNFSLWGVQIQTESAATSYVKPSGGIATTSAARATVGTRFNDYSDLFVAGDAEIDGNLSVNDALTKLVRNDNIVLNVKRLSSDGKLVTFLQDNTEEGDISVSGSTVSLNGAHLTRWSQLANGAERTEILRGSVLSNLDEMCEWQYGAQAEVLYTAEDELPEGVNVGDVKVPAVEASIEDNEQLNRMKVSDVEGDRNVAGVFQSWDDDDDTYTNDFYCAMTGDFVIRIAQGTTVARGDLLMSAGDGTAKPQDDDIVRSKTIAKVTSTVVSETYSDGSYCVPCVLMAC